MAEEPEPQPIPPTLVPPPSTAPPSTQGGPGAGPAAPSGAPTRPTIPPEPPPGVQPVPGQRLGDFLLIEELGAGSFAVVFLAEQISLGRQVALKVTRASDGEAQTLATLEHENVVPVYAEVIDTERQLRLLCMKFVAGTTLERVMRELSQQPIATWNGQAILDAIDRVTRHEAMFDPGALRDRQRLAESDHAQAVCWIGARVAEALAHAHSRGVLHRDVKPANILLNRYGRPLLSDFNLALNAQRGLGQDNFGGTLRYMAPEHLSAFSPAGSTSRDLVDERSDIYSLGVVLYEMLTGRQISSAPSTGPVTLGTIEQLEQERRAVAPSPRQANPDVPEVIDRVVRRCLEPEPACRYQRAADLMQALTGCLQIRQWEKAFPRALFLTRLAQRFPLLVFTLLGLVPHLLGSMVNIAYNRHAIVEGLTPEQQEVFQLILLGYNAVVYPIGVWVILRVIAPVLRLPARIAGAEPVETEELARLRRRALGFPMLVVVLSCLLWLPGGVLFPLGIHALASPVAPPVWWHFLVSFTISGLVATTYCYFGVQVFVLRTLYHRLWVDPRNPRQQARQELAPIERRLRVFQFAAGLIPLSGAMLLMGVRGDEPMTLLFRLLIVGLIGLGMAGFGVSLLASSRASATLAAMLGRSEK